MQSGQVAALRMLGCMVLDNNNSQDVAVTLNSNVHSHIADMMKIMGRDFMISKTEQVSDELIRNKKRTDRLLFSLIYLT